LRSNSPCPLHQPAPHAHLQVLTTDALGRKMRSSPSSGSPSSSTTARVPVATRAGRASRKILSRTPTPCSTTRSTGTPSASSTCSPSTTFGTSRRWHPTTCWQARSYPVLGRRGAGRRTTGQCTVLTVRRELGTCRFFEHSRLIPRTTTAR
jgi:hypothetical protein